MNIKRIIVFFLVIIILSIISITYPHFQNLTGNTIQEYYQKEQAILVRVIDGDTIEALVNNETWKIRMLGINTPEKNMPYSNSAKSFLQQFENQSIELQRDIEDTDKYNRKLRYLFYSNQLLNAQVLEQGLANSYYTKKLRYEEELLNAETNARKQELGIWQKSTETCSSCIVLSNLDAINESFTLSNICSFNCSLEGWFVKDSGRNTLNLRGLDSEEKSTYFSKKEIWNNEGDKFFLFDSKGLLVIYYEY
jgi:endonuclease YncB( thermonuclease family)